MCTNSSTCFEPQVSSLGRRLYVQGWYSLCTCKGISSHVSGIVCYSYRYDSRNHSFEISSVFSHQL